MHTCNLHREKLLTLLKWILWILMLKQCVAQILFTHDILNDLKPSWAIWGCCAFGGWHFGPWGVALSFFRNYIISKHEQIWRVQEVPELPRSTVPKVEPKNVNWAGWFDVGKKVGTLCTWLLTCMHAMMAHFMQITRTFAVSWWHISCMVTFLFPLARGTPSWRCGPLMLCWKAAVTHM